MAVAQKKEDRVALVDEIAKRVSNWNRWKNERGTLNFITEKERKHAASLIQEGIVVSLSRTLEAKDDAFNRNSRYMTRLPTDEPYGHGAPNFVVDVWHVSHHGACVTHVDSTAHIFYRGKTFNGHDHSIVSNVAGAIKGSVECMFSEGIFTRAVLLDVGTYLSQAQGKGYLPPGYEVTPEDLEATAKAEGIQIQSGDFILLRTGYPKALKEHPDVTHAGAGWNPRALEILHKWQVCMIGTDTHGEPAPAKDPEMGCPAHILALVYMGLPILDNGDFEALSRICKEKKRYFFAISLNPIRYSGGTGSAVNPIAML